VSELEARSLSSRNTLGDTTHNTNKIGLSWGGGSVWWASLCGSDGGIAGDVVKALGKDAKVPKI
jgi:hypothetical protein